MRSMLSDPNVVVIGRGPTKLEDEHHVASGHAQHRTWCDACMRARGIAGRHERRKPGREDEHPPVAIDSVYLKLDGTEDNDDDENDEVAQDKLPILIAKDVRTGTYAATCLREKRVSEYATSWLVLTLRSDGEPSIVALKTATLLASPFVDFVLRECPVVEHPTNGVAESAMREVKRQTRTLKLHFYIFIYFSLFLFCPSIFHCFSLSLFSVFSLLFFLSFFCPRERLSIPPGSGRGGKNIGWLVTWDCPLRTDSAS